MNKKIGLFIVLGLLVCLLAGCSGGIDTEEAKIFINDFFYEIENGEFANAEGYLHPERPADLAGFLEGIESEVGIDFQEGIEVVRYTNSSWSFYDTSVGGSTYRATMEAEIGNKKVSIEVEIVKNDMGYGIYNFEIDK